MQSNNPALNANTFNSRYTNVIGDNSVMTMNGTVNKSAILLAILIGAAIYPWYQIKTGNISMLMPMLLIGLIGGLVLSFVTIFKPSFSPITAPLYAIFEGVLLGAVSAIYDEKFHGIALQALMLTVGVLSLMLFLYRTKIIRVTEGFKIGMLCAMGAIGLLYFTNFILGLFGIHLSFMTDSSPLSIGLSCIIVGVASLNLILNFDVIETGVNAGSPKYMEWYGAFGLMLALVWLYMEILSLLAKLKGRD